MSTATPCPPPAPGRTSAVARPAIRLFLARYSGTVLGLLVALLALQAGWHLLSGGTWVDAHPWPAAVAVTAGWALAVGGLLRHRVRPGVLGAAAGGVAVLAVPAGTGWLPPAGLVLWGPVCTVLAVALAMAARPGDPGYPPVRRAARSELQVSSRSSGPLPASSRQAVANARLART